MAYATCPRGTVVQSLLLSRERFHTAASAKAWASRHGFRTPKVHTTARFHRIRQVSPSRFMPDSFRTIVLTDGVEAVIGCPSVSTLRAIGRA